MVIWSIVKGMLPLRKINFNTVALTSYYGKTFISRGDRKANSSLEWLLKQINLSTFDDSGYISKVAPANVFDNNVKAPYIYSALSNHYKSLQAGNNLLIFDYANRSQLVTDDQLLLSLEQAGRIVVGITDKKQPIVVDKHSKFWVYDKAQYQPLGDIYTVLQLNAKAAPLDFSEIKIFSKAIPVGLLLGYYLGFKGVLALLKVPYTVTDSKPKVLEAQQYSIDFADQSYIFSREDTIASLLLGGFVSVSKQIRRIASEDFEHKDVYFNLFRDKGLTTIYVREADLLNQLFIDPITESILKDMGEPTVYIPLLVRATELLVNYHHPDPQDMSEMRIRGYERLSGMVYKELVTSIRQFNNRNIVGRSKIEMSPYKVWQAVMTDNTKKMVEDINPIQNLKELEIVTYTGEGGRSKDAMNKASRAFHPHDMGVISEATVDSSDVGVNTYLSPNPNFKNLRGLIKQDKVLNTTSLLSTSANLAVSATNDDTKRVGFISIQNTHCIATEGYHGAIVRTGYESVIAQRTTDLFAYSAVMKGKVVGKNKLGIVVEYEDGSRKGVNLGRQFGRAEGSVYPHDIVTWMKEGDVFEKGDIIAYNDGFFEKDLFNPNHVIMKNTMNVKTALYESNQTHEDGSAVSKRVSESLTAKTTKVKSITVSFKQALREIVKVGQDVNPKTLLAIIEDEITSGISGFDEESLLLLSNLSKQAPKAKYTGTIDKIEVFYHGFKDDMSPSLKALADYSDKVLADQHRSSGKPVISGQVTDDYRVGGTPLGLDKAEIKFYITVRSHCGTGDKIIFANQLKSVIGEVMDYDVHTESGEAIDGIFSNRGIAARIVNSPYIIGTTSTLLRVIAKQAFELYKG